MYDVAAIAAARAREGGGPSLVEARVVRWQGDFEGDPQTYRNRAEMAAGRARDPGGHHSNSVEAWFLNTPGLKLCVPATPAEAKGLLKTAIRDDDPVLVFEPKGAPLGDRARA